MTKYNPVNNHIILEKQTNDQTPSGIYLDKKEESYIVVRTQEDSKELQGKEVVLADPPIHLEGDYYATDYVNIIAYAS